MTEKQNLDQIHEELFELLVAFDKLCRDCGCNYSLHGGTLIGAKRYGDFIPWDDDADVTIMSWDYKTVLSYLNEHKDIGFRFADDDGIGHRFTRTRLEGHVMGWIDVIEYNYITSSLPMQKLRNSILIVLSAMSKNKEHVRTATVEKHGHVQIMIYKILYLIGYVFGKKNTIKLHRYISRNCFLGNKELIQRTNDQVRALRRILPIEYYKEYEEILMHGYKFMITKNYHEVLAQIYSENWMAPPPEAEQKSHDSIVREAYRNLQEKYEDMNKKEN